MAGEGIVFAQDFPKYIAEELLRRQEILRRSNMGKNATDLDIFKDMSTYQKYKEEDLEFLLGKMSFIRMTSNAVPKQWPPRKKDVMGNEYIVPNWQNSEPTDGSAKYSWRPEDDPRTITKYDIRKETVLMGGSLLFQKGANGVDNFMRPRAGFEEIYGPRSYGTITNFSLGTGATLNDQIMSASYQDSTNFAFRNDNTTYKPMPGITGISVSMGTQFIRKASIKWQCHNWEDFDVYERLYLTPGISVFLEWGWTTIDRILPILDFSYNYRKPRDYFKKLMSKIVSSRGKYDAIVGVVNNFNWTVSGGVIECTTEVMSPATLLAQSSIINPELKKGKGEKLSLKDVIKKLESISTDTPQNINQEISGVSNISIESTTIQVYKYTWGSNDTDNSGRYISWGDFEKILTVYVSPASLSEGEVKEDNSSNESTMSGEEKKENITEPASDENTDDGNLFQIHSADFGIDNSTTQETITKDKLNWLDYKTVGNNMFLCSCDPKVCLLPGQLFLSNPIFDDLKEIPKLEKSPEPKTFYSIMPTINTDTTNDRSIGILNNILININFIKEQLDGVENLRDLFEKKIYKGIQDACGNMYQFEFIQSIYDPFVMQTHDRLHAASQTTAMLFKARGNDSITKAISVNGEIPGTLASAMWIRANSPDEIDPSGEKTIFSRDGYVDGFLGGMDSGVKKPTKEVWNKLSVPQKEVLAKKFNMSVEDFSKSYEPKTTGSSGSSGTSGISGTTKSDTSEETTKKSSTEDILEVSASTEEDEDKYLPLHTIFQNKIIRFYQALRFVYKNYSKDYVETARARLVQLLYISEKIMESGTFDNRLLPIKLNVTIDGISGILYNQAITTNLLPQRYFANVIFRVIEISNEINSGGWSTTLGGRMSITPTNYKIWMRNSESGIVDAVPVKYYDKLRNILNKLDYNKIREGIMSEKIKLVKLKPSETKKLDEKTGTNTETGTGTNLSGNTQTKTIPTNTKYKGTKNEIIESARMSIGENGYAMVDFKVSDFARVYWYGNDKNVPINSGNFGPTTSTTAQWNFSMQGQKQGENSFTLVAFSTGQTAIKNTKWDTTLNYTVKAADLNKIKSVGEITTPGGTKIKNSALNI